MIRCRPIFASAINILMASIAVFAQSSTNTIVFPPVTLSPAETASLNIMSASADFPGWDVVGTCQAVVSFYRADGSIIGTPTTFTLGGSRQVSSAQLPYASAGLNASPAVVSTQITLTESPVSGSSLTPPLTACTLAFSLETFDSATGVTHLVIPAQAEPNITKIGAISSLPCIYPAKYFCDLLYDFERLPSQVTVIPPVGLSSTETVQIDITSAAAAYTVPSADTCDGSITFYESDGSALASLTTFTLAKITQSFFAKTTQSFSARLPYASIASKIPRPEISAQISLTALPAIAASPPSSVLPCIAAFSVKTYDTATGAVHTTMVGSTVPDMASTVTAESSPPVHRVHPR